MKISKITGVFYFLFILLINAQPFSIKISLEKKEFLIHEPIVVLIEIKNQTDTSQNIIFDVYSNHFKPNLLHNGTNIKCNNVSGSGGHFKPTILKSGTSELHIFKLNSFFGCTNSSKKNQLPGLEHLLPGEYSINIENYFGNKLYRYRERDLVIESNTVEFSVKTPEKSEHRIQLEKYKSLMKKYYDLSVKEVEKKIEGIISLDNNSPYSVLALDRLISNYRVHCKPDIAIKQIIQNTCEKFPDSFVSLAYMMADMRILKEMVENKELKGKRIQVLGIKYKKAIEKNKGKNIETLIRKREEEKQKIFNKSK